MILCLIYHMNLEHRLQLLGGSLEALCDKIITDPKQIDEYHLADVE